jgi:hypothetical protein
MNSLFRFVFPLTWSDYLLCKKLHEEDEAREALAKNMSNGSGCPFANGMKTQYPAGSVCPVTGATVPVQPEAPGKAIYSSNTRHDLLTKLISIC